MTNCRIKHIEAIKQFLEKVLKTELFNAEVYFLSQLPAKIIWSEVLHPKSKYRCTPLNDIN